MCEIEVYDNQNTCIYLFVFIKYVIARCTYTCKIDIRTYKCELHRIVNHRINLEQIVNPL